MNRACVETRGLGDPSVRLSHFYRLPATSGLVMA